SSRAHPGGRADAGRSLGAAVVEAPIDEVALLTATGDRPSIETRLAAAGHPPLRRLAWIEVDLEAIAGNARAIAQMAGCQAVMPVVKAEAYGHGMVPVARTLVSAGAAALCVATLDEAIALRAAGLSIEILVLYPIPPSGVPEAVARGITITAGTPADTAAM